MKSKMETQNVILNDFQIGQRFEDFEGFKGTIKYIGTVIVSKSPQDLWLGSFSSHKLFLYIQRGFMGYRIEGKA